jgi:hypothetical protein
VTRFILVLYLFIENHVKGAGKEERKCLRAHLVGTPRAETKLMLDDLFTAEKLAALQSDLDFIFGSYETKENAGRSVIKNRGY